MEKTTVTRVIPTDFSSDEKKLPDFWSYIERLESADWERHLLYVYRRLSDTGPMVPLEKSCGYIQMANNVQVPVGNKEEFEFALQQKYGGGTYRLLLKKGAERVGDHRIVIEGPPKAVVPAILVESAPNANGSTDTASDVAKTAMNLVGNRDAEAVNVAINALRGASEVVQRFSGASNGNGDELTREFMRVMLARALNPPDPLDSIAKLAATFQTIMGAFNPGGAQNPTFQKIIDSALEKLMNPPVSGGPATSTTTALVQTLPAIASHVKEALTEWRVGMEVQRDVILRSQPQAQLPPGAPAQPSPTVIQPPRPAPGAPPEGQQMSGPPLDFIEMKIVEILRETMGEPNGADIAGEEVFIFVDRMDPRLTAHLAGMGEAGLFQLFQERPILKTVATNTPRLQEFIKAFLKYAKPPEAPGNGAVVPAKPN